MFTEFLFDPQDVKAKGSASSKICRFDTDSGGGSPKSLHARRVYSVVTVKYENAEESMQERKIPHNAIKVIEVRELLTYCRSCGLDICWNP